MFFLKIGLTQTRPARIEIQRKTIRPTMKKYRTNPINFSSPVQCSTLKLSSLNVIKAAVEYGTFDLHGAPSRPKFVDQLRFCSSGNAVSYLLHHALHIIIYRIEIRRTRVAGRWKFQNRKITVCVFQAVWQEAATQMVVVEHTPCPTKSWSWCSAAPRCHSQWAHALVQTSVMASREWIPVYVGHKNVRCIKM